MKKLNLVFCALFTFHFISCSDNVKLEKEDVTKYEWLKPFIFIESTDFSGVHNIDSGVLNFNYKLSNTKNALFVIDSIAEKNNWKIKVKKSYSRVFSKNVVVYGEESNYGEESKETLININNNIQENKLYFEVN